MRSPAGPLPSCLHCWSSCCKAFWYPYLPSFFTLCLNHSESSSRLDITGIIQEMKNRSRLSTTKQINQPLSGSGTTQVLKQQQWATFQIKVKLATSYYWPCLLPLLTSRYSFTCSAWKMTRWFIFYHTDTRSVRLFNKGIFPGGPAVSTWALPYTAIYRAAPGILWSGCFLYLASTICLC